MRKSLIALLAVLLCFVGSSCSVCRNSGKSEQEEVKATSSISPEKFSPDVLIISYDAEVGKKALLKAVKDYKAEMIYDISDLAYHTLILLAHFGIKPDEIRAELERRKK